MEGQGTYRYNQIPNAMYLCYSEKHIPGQKERRSLKLSLRTYRIRTAKVLWKFKLQA